MWEWLLAPVDGSRSHDFSGLIIWHARLMVLAWGIMLPAGVLIARYFKVLPGQDWPRELDNKTWWHAHLFLQITGTGLMLAGIAIAFFAGGRGIGLLHEVLGWLIALFGLGQFLSGFLRGSKGGPTEPAPDGSWRGDHYDMTPRRILFERFHKTVGYLLLLAAAGNIVGGMWAVNAPNWMWIAIIGFWLGLIAVAIAREASGRTIVTYPAIWGPDKVHPGNQPQNPS